VDAQSLKNLLRTINPGVRSKRPEVPAKVAVAAVAAEAGDEVAADASRPSHKHLLQQQPKEAYRARPWTREKKKVQSGASTKRLRNRKRKDRFRHEVRQRGVPQLPPQRHWRRKA
jgi:hypothetical protein